MNLRCVMLQGPRTGRVAAAGLPGRPGSRAARAPATRYYLCARRPLSLSLGCCVCACCVVCAAPRDPVYYCVFTVNMPTTTRAINRLHGRLHTPRAHSHTRMHRPSPYAYRAPPPAHRTRHTSARSLRLHPLGALPHISSAPARAGRSARLGARPRPRLDRPRVREAHAEHARRLLAGHLAVAVAIRAVEQLHRAALATGGKGGGKGGGEGGGVGLGVKGSG